MSLFLVNIPCDMRYLKSWGARRGLVVKGIFDEGYALHKLLSESFGVRVLQPFRLFSSLRGQQGSIYAYCNTNASELRDLAQSFALPEVPKILDLNQLRSKQMPSQLRDNQRLGFDVRVRPVRRSRLEFDSKTGKQNGKRSSRSEIDSYVWEHIHSNANRQESASSQELTRESVYRDWMLERLGSAANLEVCSLHAFKRSTVIRGHFSLSEGPDVVLHGTLSVRDSDRFKYLLENGVGRHRAFGYGMLLLRPPR